MKNKQKNKDTKRLVLFFTHDISLKIWDEKGLFAREIRPYITLAEEYGWDITFVTDGTDEDLQYRDRLAPIRICPAWQGRKKPDGRLMRLLLSPLTVLRLRQDIKDTHIYKSNQIWGSWNAVLAKWFYGGKTLIRGGYEYLSFTRAQGHGTARRVLAWLVSWFAYRFADRIVLATQEDAKFAREVFSFLYRKEIDIQPNWIDTDLFSPKDSDAYDADVITFGRLTDQKNLPALIDAVAQCGASLSIYGEGELQGALQAQAKAAGADVLFHGRVANDELPHILSRHKLFALPSHYEGNPKALLEAMSCGMAVIGANSPGIREVIRDGQSGVLCDPRPKELAAAIKELLADEAARTRLGEAARQQIVSENSLSTFLDAENERLHAFLPPALRIPDPLPPLPEKPMISVVISAYNAQETLRASVESVIAQDGMEWELILIDDGSTDNTPDIAKGLAAQDERIRFVRQDNTGLTIALNRGCALARGALIARLDADDECLPARFEKQARRFLAQPDLLLLGGGAEDEAEDGTVTIWRGTADEEIAKHAALFTPFPHSTAMFRADAFHALGGYDERLKTAQDTELWMRFAKAGRIAMLQEPIIKRRVHEGMISRKRRFRQFADALRARLWHYEGSKIYAAMVSVASLALNLMPAQMFKKQKP